MINSGIDVFSRSAKLLHTPGVNRIVTADFGYSLKCHVRFSTSRSEIIQPTVNQMFNGTKPDTGQYRYYCLSEGIAYYKSALLAPARSIHTRMKSLGKCVRLLLVTYRVYSFTRRDPLSDWLHAMRSPRV